jgi:hypothetical protein
MRKRKRPAITVTKVAIAIAIAMTVLAMAASGSIVLSGGRQFAEGIHQLSLLLMLIAYLFLIGVVMTNRKQPVALLKVVENDEGLTVSPCSGRQVLVADQSLINMSTDEFSSTIIKDRRYLIRVLIARELSIPESFLDTLALLPNITVLDFQNASVDSEFWLNLEEFPSVAHVLATNAISKELLRNVSSSLPEVKFWLDKNRKIIVGSMTASPTSKTSPVTTPIAKTQSVESRE